MTNGVIPDESLELPDIYKKIQAAPLALTKLLKATGSYYNVLRGYPETAPTRRGNLAVCNLQEVIYESTHGLRNSPRFLNGMIGIVCKGTKTEVHDNIIELGLKTTARFSNEKQLLDENYDWIHLTDETGDNVRNTVVTGFKIVPSGKAGSLLTTAIIDIKCDVRWNI